MSLEDITARMRTINAAVTGIVTAVEDPPNKIDNADVPLVFTVPYEGEFSDAAMGLGRIDHRLTIMVWGQSPNTGLSRYACVDALKPFVRRFRDAYAAAIRLNDLSGVSFSRLDNYRFDVRSYSGNGGDERAVLEIYLTVVEKESIAYDT